jgi:uncharacterized protein (TIGR00661 family)
MNILVAAFDWGLGHTTRSIAVIQNLCSEGHNVIIGASPNQMAIYNEHFSDAVKIEMRSTSPKLSKGKSQIFAVIKYLPAFALGIYRDKHFAKEITRKYKIDRIISDNRYGLRSKKTFNVIITHQLNIQIPHRIKFLQPFAQAIIRYFIDKFDECQVPDFAYPDNLSGKLSFPVPKLRCQVKFIGILSRLQVSKPDNYNQPFPKILFILSGPENQRTEFENSILSEIRRSVALPDYLIIRGKPGITENNLPNSINHVAASRLKSLIQHAKYIICRAGYSTIMDLMYMKKTAMLVPTPGQTEQEYLASYLKDRGFFISVIQSGFSLKDCLSALDSFSCEEVQPTSETIST